MNTRTNSYIFAHAHIHPPSHSLSHTDTIVELKSKNGFASLAGSLIQLRLSVQNYAIAVHVDDETQILSQYNNFLRYGIPKVHSPNGNTVDKNKSEVGKFSEDYEMLDYMMCQNYTTYSSTASTPSSPSASTASPISSFSPPASSSSSSYTPSDGDYGPYNGPKIDAYTATSSTVKSATILGTTTSSIKRCD